MVAFGGTFDPVHNGHLAIATSVRDALGAVECWIVPAGTPNLRDRPRASATDRHDMLIAATEDLPAVRVIDIELHRPGGSYTIDTLDELGRAYPAIELWWVLGADAARHVREWHRTEELLQRARFVVVQRSGHPELGDAEVTALGLDAARTVVLSFTPPPVSATDVRERAAAGESLAELVPPAVAALINERGLYRR
ncbi:MAG: nicotinate-nucleotide adenylyltransferase [Candidatus Dormibacteraeota bacterium]|nr:nicotinate-nucleotide adenylyltransferase [Candidatus Dormibacteraeota bacterium]